MANFELSRKQQWVVGTALTFLAAAIIVGLLYGLFSLLARFVSTFSPVLMPLVVGAILALILRPFYLWILKRLRFPWAAALLVLLALAIPIGIGVWLFGSLLANQVHGLIEKLPVWIGHASNWVEDHLAGFWQERGDAVREQLRERSGWIAKQSATLLRHIFSVSVGVFQMIGGLFSWVMLPVYLYFLLTAKTLRFDKLRGEIPFLKEETRNDILYLADEFVDILVAFFRGQFLIALAQGVLFAAGFGLVGLQYGIAIGLILGMLSIIPFLGMIIGLAVALPLAFFQMGGGWDMLVQVLIVFGIVQVVETLFLTPRIMGERTGLHPMAVIFSLFFWGTAFGGILGMILGIPLTAFLVVFWRLLKSKYLREAI